MNTQYFWDTLFNENESTCFARTVYDLQVNSVHAFKAAHDPGAKLFSINPLHTSRRDDNVTTFRNILLEFDTGTPAEQLDVLTGVPFSTIVWSGGKSHHALIALETPLKSRVEYDNLVRRIYDKLPMVDRSVKNPSRLSRIPGAIRDNGNEQKLLACVGRVPNEQVEKWLGPKKEKATSMAHPASPLHLSPWTKYFLMFGAEPGCRNSSCFRAACDMARVGYNHQNAYERISEVVDLSERELRNCIISAFSAVSRER